MDGGTIVGCRATTYGGGIYNNGYVFMNGGRILGCVSNYGGGAYTKGTFHLRGTASITDCTAKYGGGVYVCGEKTKCYLYLGGKAVVENNSSSNVYTAKNGWIRFEEQDAPAEGMKVGVTPSATNGKFTDGTALEDYVNYFFSDVAGKAPSFSKADLSLKKASTR